MEYDPYEQMLKFKYEGMDIEDTVVLFQYLLDHGPRHLLHDSASVEWILGRLIAKGAVTEGSNR
jgi:hypothetical protein